MVPEVIISDYLMQRSVLFLCEKCGETVKMVVPVREGGTVERSYCCRAVYRVTNVDGQDHILVVRLPDRDDGDKATAMNAPPVRAY